MSIQKSKPVVLQVIPDLETGGAERTTVDIAKALTDAGWTALIASEGGRLVAELESFGAHHITLPVKSKNPLTIWRNAAGLGQLIRDWNVDLIHARSRAPAWSALLAARREKIPFVTTYHGVYNQKSRIKAFYNSVMARGDTVIANSRYTANLIQKRHPEAAGKITIIHRGSDLGALAPETVSSERRKTLADAWNVDADQPIILNMGRLTTWKGQGIVIDAMAKLTEAGDSQTIAVLAGDSQGRDKYLAELRAQIAGHGLEDRVLLVGHCADVPAALSLADVAVVASVEAEAFGRAAVEAQAAHVPVIVSDLGAVPETVLAPPERSNAERTGWRVPPGQSDALAETIRQVLDLKREDRQAVTERAARHVRANFSIEAMCEKTLKVYRSLLSDQGLDQLR
ncbi:glycosyltransferase family 4 protein [Labrenzia sp. CE80]|uniref:glycosyltransferase family 4 protein n=1 Tax=Labrenzia sp. CE80 TaxID=1788986 RepID=UPI0025706736|nr:glycosyltransferase family 4 protein [Labrenzia sp. CE80]